MIIKNPKLNGVAKSPKAKESYTDYIQKMWNFLF